MSAYIKVAVLVLASGFGALSMAKDLAIGSKVGYYDPSQIAPNTSNTSAPSNWRMTDGQLFNGVRMDGVARIAFDSDGSLNNGSYICSGTLLGGGQYVLTAAHCADNFNVMSVQFGVYNNVAKVTSAVEQAYVHPKWDGSLGTGADIAIIKLSAPVSNIQGFNISTTNDLGKTMLITGYGSTTTGSSQSGSNWNDWGWGHWAYNDADVSGRQLDAAWDPGNSYTYFGEEYLFDFDNGTQTNNALARVGEQFGVNWDSNTGQGANEGLIAGGDSGGADFVWNGTEWLISGVHSYGYYSLCTSAGVTPTCDTSVGAGGANGDWGNNTSFGDVSGSTAVYAQAEWINSVINAPVPEPTTWALMLAGVGLMGCVSRRRRQD
ncbi:trypsin-like serine protease [Roseateles sp. BYS180W]|uniref:Trypsin-like serine protease n=1 Tax=Roseateles rivi TaxID=3299028 RepID=A0ABW7FVF1_9BURK